MSHSHCIRIMLDLKDKNISFPEFFCEERQVKRRLSKVFFGTLSYTPNRCSNCGMKKEGSTIIKSGFKLNRITLNSTSHYPTYLLLNKQRFYCKMCATTFIAETKEVAQNCFISNNVQYSIAVEAKDKISEKDLTKRRYVSPTTTSRVLIKMGKQFRLNYETIPKNLSFDEFQSVKKQMSFIYTDSKTHAVIDILPDRRLNTLRNHFIKYA